MPEPAWLDPVEGDEIDDIVNWQLAGGGQRRGIHGNYDIAPTRCPNPEHTGAIWHGYPQDIRSQANGHVVGRCPGSVLYRNT
ncbi:hypothetical protein GS534_24340 [Rhodococcus hoagii]|nr:hypothetical protein [Prescottella equi]MBM4617941.1 hypothetical protein [Prescottella equi]NKS33160.1 hypothetical protein [Prescottella equi]